MQLTPVSIIKSCIFADNSKLHIKIGVIYDATNMVKCTASLQC